MLPHCIGVEIGGPHICATQKAVEIELVIGPTYKESKRSAVSLGLSCRWYYGIKVTDNIYSEGAQD